MAKGLLQRWSNLELIPEVVIWMVAGAGESRGPNQRGRRRVGTDEKTNKVRVRDAEIDVCLCAVRSAWHELCCLRVTAKTTNLAEDFQGFATDGGRDGGNDVA